MYMSSLSPFHYFKVCATSLCLNIVHNSCLSVGILARLNVSLVIGCILTLSSGWTFSEGKLSRTRCICEPLDLLRWEGSVFAGMGLWQHPRGLEWLLVFHFSSREIAEMTFRHGRFWSEPWSRRPWIGRVAPASSPRVRPSHRADSPGPGRQRWAAYSAGSGEAGPLMSTPRAIARAAIGASWHLSFEIFHPFSSQGSGDPRPTRWPPERERQHDALGD